MRYFNLKLGKPDVFGGVLRINPASDLETRVEDYDYEPDKIVKFVKADKNGAFYDVIIPNVAYPRGEGTDMLGGSIGVPVRVEKGSADVVGIHVTNQGEAKIVKMPGKKKVFLSEITKKQAEDLRESERCWDLQRMWIYE